VAAVQAALGELGLPDTSAVLRTDPLATLKVQRVGRSSLVAALRFLYDDPTGALAGCDFVYTGDVDIFIEREPVSLLAYHAYRMLATGQPYYNIRRNIALNVDCPALMASGSMGFTWFSTSHTADGLRPLESCCWKWWNGTRWHIGAVPG